MNTTIKGWIVQVGVPPQYRPFVAGGPSRDALQSLSDTRVDGGFIFRTRREARKYAAESHDPSDVRVCRATVTLKVEAVR